MKHRLFSLINIVGLSLGLAAAMAILLFVRDELSVDGFWTDGEQIFSVALHGEAGKDANSLNWTSALMALTVTGNTLKLVRTHPAKDLRVEG